MSKFLLDASSEYGRRYSRWYESRDLDQKRERRHPALSACAQGMGFDAFVKSFTRWDSLMMVLATLAVARQSLIVLQNWGLAWMANELSTCSSSTMHRVIFCTNDSDVSVRRVAHRIA